MGFIDRSAWTAITAAFSSLFIGAGGVGATIAYATVISGVAREIALFDTDASKVRSEVPDLNHGLRPGPIFKAG